MTLRRCCTLVWLTLAVACTKDLELPPDPARAPPGTVYGRIVVQVPGQSARRPAPGATVELLGSSLSARADDDGRFLLDGVVQKEGRLLARLDVDGDGRAERQRMLDLAAIGAGPGRDISVGDLPLAENARMHGRVLLADRADQPAGHRLTTVYVPGAPYTTVTNDDGSWSLADLPEGPVQVSFFHPGYVPADLSGLLLRSGEEFTARELVLAKEPLPPPPGSILGLVMLAPGADAPAPDPSGADVVALDALGRSIPASVGAGGVFRIADVPAGLYDLRASHEGYATAVVRNVLVASAAEISLPPIVLRPGASTASCVPDAPCHLPGCRAGQTDCATGVAVCVDQGPAVDGAECGVDQVCSGGACVACKQDESCVPDDQPCKEGRVTCRTGAAVCVAMEANANGRPCGTGAVCWAGACKACDHGAPCDLEGAVIRDGDCRQGTTDCSTGSPVCLDLGALKPTGTACGVVEGMVCSGAACVPCALPPEGQRRCQPTTNPCNEGAYSCRLGRLACEDLGVPGNTGLSCGTGLVCHAGACEACDDDPAHACTPPNTICRKGAPSCSSGTLVCTDVGPADTGTPCGSGHVCRSGACVPSGFSVVSGNAGTARIASAGAPIVVLLADAQGRPLANEAITVTSPEGGGAVPSSGATNSQGRFTFSPRMPRLRGTYEWRVSVGGGQDSVLVSYEATTPAPGTVFALVNADHGSGNDGVPGPGPLAHVGRSVAVAVAGDGTVYFSDVDYHCVRKLSREGLVTNVTAPGGPGFSGDGGLASRAAMSAPYGLALDDTAGARVLYVSDHNNGRVRAIDLESGTIDTVVGGNGSAIAPAYGDGSTGLSAALAAPTHLTFGPDRRLYIADRGHSRIRVYDPATGLVDEWLTPVTNCTSAELAFAGCGGGAGCKVSFDASGDAWVGGYMLGSAVGNGCSPVAGVLRRNRVTGAITAVAGYSGGSAANGIPATVAGFAAAPVPVVAPSGDVVTADESGHVVRRIEAGTGRIRTLAGAWQQAGYGTDGAAMLDARFAGISSMELMPGGDLLVTDTSAAVRLIAGAVPSTTSSARLSVASGGGQTVIVGQAATEMLGASLTDDAGAPLAGYLVRWSAVDEGGGLYAAAARTDASGVARVRVRAGRKPGSWRFEARFEDVAGRPATGSPATFTLTAREAPAGTVHTLVNLDRSRDFDPGPIAGPIARSGSSKQVALATDGTLYFADYDHHRVRRLSPGGLLTTIAGTGASGVAGDGGPATQAQFNGPFGVALDEAGRKLYVADHHNGRVRRIDLALDPPVIETYAGGGNVPAPGYGDSGPATQASLSAPTFLSVGPDRTLYIADRGHERVRRVAPDGTISTFLLGVGGCTSASVTFAGCGDTGCVPAFDAAGNAYVGGVLTGSSTGSACNGAFGLVKVAPGGKPIGHLLGRTGGYVGDGRPGTETTLSSAPIPLVDAGGNVLFTDPAAHLVRRLESSTRRVTTLAGSTGGYAGDWEPVTAALFSRPYAMALDARGSLYVPDHDNVAIRVLEGVAGTAAGTAVLSAVGGMAQTVSLNGLGGQLLAAKLLDGAGAPMVGYTLQFEAVDEGAGLYQSSAMTDTGGVARVQARAGWAPGTYRFRARYTGLDGTDVSGSPASFSLTASAPTSGQVFTVVNVDRTSGSSGMPGSAAIARVTAPGGMVRASDGTVYFADRWYVRKLSPSGLLVNLAGTGVAEGTGDLGPARAAGINNATAVALDASETSLYVAESNENDVRRIDLATGTITTAIGRGTAGGPGYGDSGPATAAQLQTPLHLARGPDGGIYVADIGHHRIRRYDPVSTVISQWVQLPTGNSCSPSEVVELHDCSNGGCFVAFDAAGDAYLSGLLFGTSPGAVCGNGTYGIVKRNRVTGALMHIAGYAGGTFDDDIAATSAGFASPPVFALDGAGGLITVDAASARVRRIDLATGLIRTISGTGSQGFAGEYVSATGAVWDRPSGVLALPGGHLLVADTNNACVREIW